MSNGSLTVPRSMRPHRVAKRSLWIRRCLFGAAAMTLWSGRAQADDTSEPRVEPDAANDAKEAARTHFDKGVQLMRDGSWDAALAEFVSSLALYKTKNARKNAATCLQQLQRYDEALAIYESLDNDSDAHLTEEERQSVRAAMRTLQDLTGWLDIRSDVDGATVVVDGKERGTTPKPEGIRVSAGTRSVRLTKAGYLPFEARPLVAGGSRVIVTARLQLLAPVGRLKIVEKSGATADVIVDGTTVGVTPFESVFAPGMHSIWLRGTGTLGTQPVARNVVLRELTAVTLQLEELPGEARISSALPDAKLQLDGVVLATSRWDGRLRSGPHTLVVSAPGYHELKQAFTISKGQTTALQANLQRNDDDPRWPRKTKQRWTVSALGSFVGLTSFGGDYDGSCGELETECYRRVRPMGASFGGRAGYEVAPRLRVEAGIGYLWARSELARHTWLQAESTRVNVDITDRVTLSSLVVQVGAVYTQPLRAVRLSGGLHFGLLVSAKVTNTRGGTTPCVSSLAGRNDCSSVLTAESSTPVPMALTGDIQNRTIPFVEPQLRVSLPLGQHLSLGCELAALIVIPGTVRPCDGASNCRFSQAPQVAPGDPQRQPTYDGQPIGLVESTTVTRESMMGTFVLPRLGVFAELAF